MSNLLARLSSRKFWLAIAAFIVFVANGQHTEALGAVLAYLGIEGTVDAIATNKSQ